MESISDNAQRYGLISRNDMQVPVIQQAGLLSVMDIALRLQELHLMAEEGHLHQENLEGMASTILERMASNSGLF